MLNAKELIGHDVLYTTEQGAREQGHAVMYTPDKEFSVIRSASGRLRLVHPLEVVALTT